MAKYAISLGRLKNVIVFDKDDGPLISVKRLDGGSNEYAGKSIVADGAGAYSPTTTSGTGDVEGPGSSTDNALARFHLTTGKIIQNSVGILDDSGNLTGVNITPSITKFSGTDKLLGRATAGAGDGEEIDCSAAGRWFLTGFAGTVTISGGEITPTGHIHAVATEGGSGSDDLDTIDTTGVPPGARLILAAADDANTVVVKNGTGNIYCGADFSLDSELDTIELILTGAGWLRLSQADNG